MDNNKTNDTQSKDEEKIIADRKIMEDIKAGSKDYSKEDINNMYIRSLFKTRIWGALWRKGIKNMGDLQNLTESNFANIRGLGNKSLEEVKTIMGILGLSFKAISREKNNRLNNQEEPVEEKTTQRETEDIEEPMPSKEKKLNYDINTVIFSNYKQKELYKAGIYSIKGLLNCDECSLHSVMLSGREQLISRIHKMGFEFKFEEKRRADAELVERIKNGESYSVEEAKNIYITNIPGVSFRVAYRLAREGIMNAGDVCQNSEETLKNIRVIGETTLKKVKDGVHVLNLKLKGERSDDEILAEKINELKLAYTELQRRKNTYKLKVKKLEQEIKRIQGNNEKLNKQLKRVEAIINQNKEGLIEDNLLENFNEIFDKIMHKFEMNSWMLDSKNSAIGRYNEMIARAEEKQRPIKEQLGGHEL